MYERCVVLNGFSKAFAMTGWRMGIAAGPAEVIFHMNKIHQFTTMSAGTTSQVAALEALTSPVRDEEIDVMRKEYDERRKIMVDGFRNMGLDVTEPEGAFYVFPSIKKQDLPAWNFVTVCCRNRRWQSFRETHLEVVQRVTSAALMLIPKTLLRNV